MTTYLTTYPTLRQRIRLADAIVLADGWRAGDSWPDELDEHARTLSLVTVRPTRVLKGEPDEQMTLLTTDQEMLAATFDAPGAAVLVLQHDPLAQRYVLLFDTVLPVDEDRVRVPEGLADEAAGPGLTLDDLAAMVAEDEAAAAEHANLFARYEADVLASPMPAPTELAGAADLPDEPAAGPRYAEPDQPD